MVDVNNIVPDSQIGIGENPLRRGFLLFVLLCAAGNGFRVGGVGRVGRQHRKARFGQFKSERIDARQNHRNTRCQIGQRNVVRTREVRRNAVIKQRIAQILCGEFIFCEQQQSVAAGQIAADILAQRFVAVGIGNQLFGTECENTRQLFLGACRERIAEQCRCAVDRIRKVRLPACVFGVFRVDRAVFQKCGDRLSDVPLGRGQPFGDLRRVKDEHRCGDASAFIVGKVVEQTFLFGIEIRDIFIEESRFRAAVERFQLHAQGFLARFRFTGFCLFGDQRTQFRLLPGGHQHFARRRQETFGNLLNLALGQRVKNAHLVDHVAEELHADGICAVSRVNIENTAAQGIFADTVNEVTADISRVRQGVHNAV